MRQNQFDSKEPAPYTVIQYYAARLQFNLAKTVASISFETPKFTIKNDRRAMIFNEEDFMVKWIDRRKFTLIEILIMLFLE